MAASRTGDRGFDVANDGLQVAFEILVAVGGHRRLVHRRAVRHDDQNPPRLRALQQAGVRPQQGLAVDVLLEHLVVEKQPERDARAAPRHVGALDDDVLEGVEPAGLLGIAVRRPFARRLAAVPFARGESQHLALHAAALEHAREDLDRQRGDQHRPAAHRSRVIDQQRHDGARKRRLAFLLERAGAAAAGDEPGQARPVEHALRPDRSATREPGAP